MFLLELCSCDQKSRLTALACVLKKHLLLMLRYPLPDNDEVWVVLLDNKVSLRSRTISMLGIKIEESLPDPSAMDTGRIPVSQCPDISC